MKKLLFLVVIGFIGCASVQNFAPGQYKAKPESAYIPVIDPRQINQKYEIIGSITLPTRDIQQYRAEARKMGADAITMPEWADRDHLTMQASAIKYK